MTKLELANSIIENRSNGAIQGYSTSKGGRAWIDGEFCLDELESISIIIRDMLDKEDYTENGFYEQYNQIKQQEMADRMRREVDSYISSHVKELVETNIIGNKIFNDIFKLNDEKLLQVLESISKKYIIENGYNLSIFSNPDVTRTVKNEMPYKIEINHYDSIIVDSSGINYNHEHKNSSVIVKFDSSFKL